ncbi:MAG TPA: hypothetical protein VIM16_01905 [Mucilaginibacter sp.]|jgi:hypothetical protein
MKPFIPITLYGVLTYLISLTLIASPWLFGLINVSSAAFLLPLYIGWLQLIMCIFADTEVGFVKQLPLQMHMVVESVMGFILMVSPWVYTFSSKAFWPQLLLGGLLIFLVVFTKRSPILTKAHHAAREGLLKSTDSFEGRLNI